MIGNLDIFFLLTKFLNFVPILKIKEPWDGANKYRINEIFNSLK